MRTLVISTFILGSFAASAAAQGTPEPHNFTRGTTTSWVIRDSRAGGFYAGRLPDEAVRGLPPMIGGRVRVYDFVAATPDTFNLIVFDETASGSHTPNSTPIFDLGPNPLVSGWVSVRLSGPPIYVVSKDIWVGTRMTAAWSTGNDGGYQYFLRGYTPTTNREDLAGRRVLPTGNPLADRTYVFGATTPSTGSALRTFYAELLYSDTAGVGAYAIAKTNQPDQPGINNDNIIGGFNSGRNPDVTGHNAGRQDDFGFEVQGKMAINMPVAFFVGPQFGPNIPLNVGVFCLDIQTMIPLGATVGDGVGMASVLLPNALGQALVAAINNPDIYWGAVVIDTKGNRLIGTPCAQQRL